MRRVLLVLLAIAAGCTLYSDVSISPLLGLSPADLDQGSDLPSMVRKGDYLRALEQPARSATDLVALGNAELIAGRFDLARRHLRAALDRSPFRTTYAEAAWQLSQLEYLVNNFEASLDWAHVATEHGLTVRPWHVSLLEALRSADVYRFRGPASERVPLHIGHPDVPRVEVKVNGSRNIAAIVDSGAVMSIVSRRFADSVPVHRLGTFEGTFVGLLGEPIPVTFGLIESLQIGRMTIENVPVAIMPDDKMRFVVQGNAEFAIDVLLGAHLLKELRLELDFRRDRATFTHLTAADRRPASDQNLFWDHFRPAVRGTINHKGWFVFVLDTGSEVTFLNEARLSSLPVQLFTKMHNATLQGLGGSTKRGDRVDDVEIGIDRWAGRFRSLPMYEPTASEGEQGSGIVGENFLKNFVVVIDFGRMRVDLTPISRIIAAERALDSPANRPPAP